MILSDRDIKAAVASGEIFIDPYDEANVQPASYDLHLGNEFLVFDNFRNSVIDPKKRLDRAMNPVKVGEGDHFVLHSGRFALGMVHEATGVSDSMVGRLEGKSSLARLGLIIHTTAGFLDPGNRLHLTLELHNAAEIPILLYPMMPVGQIAFEPLSSPAENPYGSTALHSKYSGDTVPVASQMYKNFDTETGEWK